MEDLRSRAIMLAGHLFDLADGRGVKEGMVKAERLLQNGSAWGQFKRITEAQGGQRSLGEARFRRPVLCSESGTIVSIDNRRLARVAKLAGAPASSTAGLRLLATVGDRVTKGEPLYELLSDSPGQQDYALAFNELKKVCCSALLPIHYGKNFVIGSIWSREVWRCGGSLMVSPTYVCSHQSKVRTA
nr:hypothetical protein [Marinobacter flavimaris]